MKKLFFILIFVSTFISFSLFSPLAIAQIDDPIDKACTDGNASSSPVCQDTPDNPIYGPDGILTRVIEILGWFIGVAAVIMIIISGLRMVLSTGNSETVASAKNGVIFALVGVVVAILAQVLVIFVLRKL